MTDRVTARLERIVRERITQLGVDRATVRAADGYVEVAPVASGACPFAVQAQSEREISLFVGPPANPTAMAVDVYDPAGDAVLARIGRYVDAILRGDVVVTADRDGRQGEVTFALEDGELTHHYTGSRRPRSAPVRFVYHAY